MLHLSSFYRDKFTTRFLFKEISFEFPMNRNDLPDLISDLNDRKMKIMKKIPLKNSKTTPSRFSVEELLQRSGESKCNSVYSLDLRCEKLECVPSMKEFRHLKSLDISSNCIERLENLQYFPEMKELKAFDNHLHSLSDMSGLKELIVLQLQYNQITNIETNALSSCRKLKQIRLDNNRLSQLTLKDFASCSNLTYLDISFNKIQSIAFITSLPNLEEFYASNNLIEVIPDLSRCKKLSELQLNNNVITNISGIKDHKSLMILDVSKNKITSLSNLGVLNKIELVNLSYNSISLEQLKVLSFLFPNLEVLNIGNNHLKDIQATLEYLSHLPNLCELCLQDNEFPVINEETRERYNASIVTTHIPELKMLDNVCIKKPNQQIINNNTPLPMRPLTAAAGVSLRQVENQLTNLTQLVTDMQSKNQIQYNKIIESLASSTVESEPNSLTAQPSTECPTRKTIRNSRLSDALVFASVNYSAFE